MQPFLKWIKERYRIFNCNEKFLYIGCDFQLVFFLYVVFSIFNYGLHFAVSLYMCWNCRKWLYSNLSKIDLINIEYNIYFFNLQNNGVLCGVSATVSDTRVYVLGLISKSN